MLQDAPLTDAMPADRPARRTRKGRAQTTRSAEPGQNLHLRTPYITRRIPTYDLTPEAGDR